MKAVLIILLTGWLLLLASPVYSGGGSFDEYVDIAQQQMQTADYDYNNSANMGTYDAYGNYYPPVYPPVNNYNDMMDYGNSFDVDDPDGFFEELVHAFGDRFGYWWIFVCALVGFPIVFRKPIKALLSRIFQYFKKWYKD